MPGQYWLEVALERIRAGEDEKVVMVDYGYIKSQISCEDCTCKHFHKNFVDNCMMRKTNLICDKYEN